MTEDAKAQAKLGILQSTVEQNRAIELANQQFQNQLSLFEATQSQNAGANNYAGQTAQNQLAYQMLNAQTPNFGMYNVSNINQGQQAPALSGGTGKPYQDQFTLPGFG